CSPSRAVPPDDCRRRGGFILSFLPTLRVQRDHAGAGLTPCPKLRRQRLDGVPCTGSTRLRDRICEGGFDHIGDRCAFR
ncbi:MAG TPA: hypothetical protein VHU80_13535, partial [Polyangiaceae bacterium]|nr:hypothetical protein [Polyangiaceae bacterium]